MTKADQILTDPSASYWLKEALHSALKRDPVDVTNDMEALAAALAEWAAPTTQPHGYKKLTPQTMTACGHAFGEFCNTCSPGSITPIHLKKPNYGAPLPEPKFSCWCGSLDTMPIPTVDTCYRLWQCNKCGYISGENIEEGE